jgi:hypothetical protein
MPVKFSLLSDISECRSISDFPHIRCQGGGLRILSRRLETQTRTFEM